MTLVHYVSDDISQLVPVIYAYRDRFATHVLVCDAMTLPQAEQLWRGMERFAAGYQLRWQVTIRTVDAADPSAVPVTLLPELGRLDRVWFHVWYYFSSLFHSGFKWKHKSETGGKVE